MGGRDTTTHPFQSQKTLSKSALLPSTTCFSRLSCRSDKPCLPGRALPDPVMIQIAGQDISLERGEGSGEQTNGAAVTFSGRWFGV